MIDLKVITHCLNINLNHHPIKQKRRVFILKCFKDIKVDVNKLLKVGL